MELNTDYKDKYTIKIPFKSKYYMNLLDMNDQYVWHTMIRCTLTNRCTVFDEGVLIANVRQSVLLEKMNYNMCRATLIKSIEKLDQLGVIVKCSNKEHFKNNVYVLGVRGKGEYDRFYFLDHLIIEYEPILERMYENACLKHGDGRIQRITDVTPFCMNEAYKMFIQDNIDKPNYLMHNVIKDGKNLTQLLFHVNEYFMKPLDGSNRNNPCLNFRHGMSKKQALYV